MYLSIDLGSHFSEQLKTTLYNIRMQKISDESPEALELFEERYQELAKVIPLNCNIVTGILDEELNVDLVGTLRHEDGDIVAQPPFMRVQIIVDHYWLAAEAGATFVINYGREDQVAWKRENNKWVKDVSVRNNNSRKRRIITLSDVGR